MSYTSLMVYIEADATPEQRVRLAASLADQFNAFLIGLSAVAIPPPMTTDGVIMDMMRTKLAQQGDWFRGVAGANQRKIDWRSMLDFPATALPCETRRADLVIVGQVKAPANAYRALDPASDSENGTSDAGCARGSERPARRAYRDWMEGYSRSAPRRGRCASISATGDAGHHC